MKIISFVNQKGGVGKTATTTAVGHMLATVYGKRTLLIDVDPQGNSSNLFSNIHVLNVLTSMLEDKIASELEYSVEDLLLDPELDIHKCIRKTEYEKFDIIPSLLTLSEVEEMLKANIRIPQQFKLKHHLEKLAEQDEYDYCIIDCSPSISLVNINALAASDEVFIPMKCDANSSIGMCIAKNLIKTVSAYNPNLKLAGCFFTQWNGRGRVDRQIYELLQEYIPNELLPIKIRANKKVEELTYTNTPLLAYDSGKNKCTATLDYLDLTKYIVSSDEERERIKKEYEERKGE